MAKTGALFSSAGRGDLILQTRVSFEVTPAESYAAITPPSCAPSTVTAITTGAGQTTACTELQFNMAADTVIPAWLKPGAGLSIAFTVSGNAYSFRGVVNAIDTADGTYFVVSLNFHDAQFTSTSWNAQAITSATATLLIQAQEVTFLAPSGNAATVTLADCADADGNVAWTEALTEGQDYTYTAPVGVKFDIKDYAVKSSNGTDQLIISFI